MPDTTTTFLGLTKPEVGGSADSWGTKSNTNLDLLDDALDGTTAIRPNLTAGQWKVGGVNVTATAADLNRTVGMTAAGQALVDDADAAAQRTTLGLGSLATQAASAVAITGGSIAGITDLAVADGGTGASTAAAARSNLGLGTAATLASMTDDTLATATDSNIPTASTVKTYVDTAVAANGGKIGQTYLSSEDARIQVTGIEWWKYTKIVCVLENLTPVTAGADLLMLISEDGGASWGSSYDVSATRLDAGATATISPSNSTSIPITRGGGVSSTAGHGGVSGDVTLVALNNGNNNTAVIWQVFFMNSGTTPIAAMGGARRDATSTGPNAVRFQFSSGNVQAGAKVTLYGYVT